MHNKRKKINLKDLFSLHLLHLIRLAHGFMAKGVWCFIVMNWSRIYLLHWRRTIFNLMDRTKCMYRCVQTSGVCVMCTFSAHCTLHILHLVWARCLHISDENNKDDFLFSSISKEIKMIFFYIKYAICVRVRYVYVLHYRSLAELGSRCWPTTKGIFVSGKTNITMAPNYCYCRMFDLRINIRCRDFLHKIHHFDIILIQNSNCRSNIIDIIILYRNICQLISWFSNFVLILIP